ncbi:hypothetical protein ABT040_29745 [Streptomyces sp. NPDC002688]|uniref:hypothetical protein n=1 Tax=Streptomyces sp. NPDC002688 TaxID=3154423 RepID=UPI003323C7B2
MIVIGDAAHVPSPTSEQGACTAYEAPRRPRVERIVKQAARINNKAADPAGRILRDLLMPRYNTLRGHCVHTASRR